MSFVSKYNVPAPRYTSYPTVPFWDNNLTEPQWITHVKKAFSLYNKDGISLYIHLPYCESLCTYCACNTRISINHKVEMPYVNALLAEWKLYLNQFNERPNIKEIHLGGGTPTFFSAENLQFLIREIVGACEITPDHDFSFEGHPSNTTGAHLQVLYDLGFKRVSFGIQDFNEKVQDTINRYQTFEEVEKVMTDARRIGYTSINVDLVYGLPYQNTSTVTETVKRIIALKPERIAFYSYAHVPWMKPGQRKYSEKDLPVAREKRKLYEAAKQLFTEANYEDVGMDHFALPEDNLFKALNEGKLHRNFMGYTTNNCKLLIGLGCSSISDTWDAFAQNIKTVEEYITCVNAGKIPVNRGHILTNEDLIIRQQILDLMCKHETLLNANLLTPEMEEKLGEIIADELAVIKNDIIYITERGRQYLRNICLVLDQRYWQKAPAQNVFSTTA